MNKKIIIPILVMLLLGIGISNAQSIFSTEQIIRMMIETHVSLGNSANTTDETEAFWHNFLIPQSAEGGTFKMSFDADCINGGANGTENYFINVWCSDGSTNIIDLSQSDCESLAYSELPNMWITIENISTQQFYGDIAYWQFSCYFVRNDTNTERIPTEFKVIVDSLGLSSKSEDANIVAQRSSISNVAEAISNIVDINVQVWRILFTIFEIMTILTAFIGIPIALIMVIRWAINKVKGGG